MYPVTIEADYRPSPPTIARGGGTGSDLFAELLRQHSDARKAAPQPRADNERNGATRPELTEKVEARDDRDDHLGDPAAEDDLHPDRGDATRPVGDAHATEGGGKPDSTVAAAPESMDDTAEAAAMPVVPVPANANAPAPAAPVATVTTAPATDGAVPAMAAQPPAATAPADAGVATPDQPADAITPPPAEATSIPAAAAARPAATAPAVPAATPDAGNAPAAPTREFTAAVTEASADGMEADPALPLTRSAPGGNGAPVSAPPPAQPAAQGANQNQPQPLGQGLSQGLSQGLGLLGSGADVALAAQAAGGGARNTAVATDAKPAGNATTSASAGTVTAGKPADGAAPAAAAGAPNQAVQPVAMAAPQAGAAQPAASFDAALDQASSDIDVITGGSTSIHGPGTPAAGGGNGAATHLVKAAPVPGTPAEQLAVQVQRAVRDGNSRITVQLNPVELGHVEVQLDFAQDGRVSATVLADRPETLDMLQRDARTLERSLQNAGLQTDSGSLSFDLRGGGQQGSGSHHMAGGNGGFGGNGNSPANSDNRRAAPVEQAAPVLTRSGDSGVDIHV